MNEIKPPYWAKRFFQWYCDPRLEEQILGDLEEQFEDDLQALGLKKARRRFLWNVIRFFRKDIIRPISKSQKLNSLTMLRHHLKLTLRSFKRFKTSFAINLIGLSTGLACTLLIYLWVNDEWQMDKFHAFDPHLYQVLQNYDEGTEIETSETTPALLAEALLEEFPMIEKATSVVPVGSYGTDGIVAYEGTQLKVLEQYASADYFSVFSFPLKTGDKGEVLKKKHQVVLSEELATKLFGAGTDPIGRTIKWLAEGAQKDYVVSGVFESIPSNSSERFDLVFTMEAFLEQYPHVREWRNSDPSTFVVLTKEASVQEFNAQLKAYLTTKQEGYPHTLMLQKYADRYLYGKYKDGKVLPGRMQYVKLFSVIAGLVLLIACINFMNLSTARASRRLKEIGVKKSMGVRRTDLVWQFFSETFFLSFIAIGVAYALAFIFLEPFNDLTGKNLVISPSPQLLGFTGVILVITSLLAGSYPALYLSGFNPIDILKGKLGSNLGDLWARKGLVILQYCASAILITSVWVVSTQIRFVQNKNLGFDKEQVIYFNADGALSERSALFVEEVKGVAGIQNAGAFGHDLLGGMGMTSGLYWEGKDPESRVRFGNLEVGFDLIETFDIEVIQGRSFSKEQGDNISKIILNEKAAAVMGLEHPIGQTIQVWGQTREIIGVVKDFHFESLHEEIKPCFFQLGDGLSSIVLRLEPEGMLKTIEKVEALYHTHNPALTFTFQFYEQEYAALYQSEQQVASISTYFAAIAILISCLGLFGLVAFTAERRQKEMGIRKVLGASVLKLVFLLSNDFSRTIFLAVLVSLPISYLVMMRWLESFVYRIELSAWFFIGSALLAFTIALITMSVQTIKAATLNPVESLKDE